MKYQKILTMAAVGFNMFIMSTALADQIKADTTLSHPEGLDNLVGRVLGAAQIVGLIIAIGMLTFAGFKYLTAGAGDKAKAKDMFVPLAVGAGLVALAPTIGNWVWSSVINTSTAAGNNNNQGS